MNEQFIDYLINRFVSQWENKSKKKKKFHVLINLEFIECIIFRFDYEKSESKNKRYFMPTTGISEVSIINVWLRKKKWMGKGGEMQRLHCFWKFIHYRPFVLFFVIVFRCGLVVHPQWRS